MVQKFDYIVSGNLPVSHFVNIIYIYDDNLFIDNNLWFLSIGTEDAKNVLIS